MPRPVPEPMRPGAGRMAALLALTSLLAPAPRAVAETAMVRLVDIRAGSEWIGWNESGTYRVSLPAGLRLGPVTGAGTVQWADGRVTEVAEGTSLRLAERTSATVAAGYLHGRHRRGGVALDCTARRIEFPGGARLEGDGEVLGPDEGGQVVALRYREPLALELDYDEPVEAELDKVEWRAAGEARAERLALAGFPTGDEPIHSLGLWAAAGGQVLCAADRFYARAERFDWVRVNGRAAAAAPPVLDAPRASVAVRRSSVRGSARVVLPMALSERGGQVAERVTVEVSGAPGVVGLSAADEAGGLEAALQRLDLERAGAGAPGEDRLAATIRDYLVPAWYGLWYDAENAREVVFDPPGLRAFAERYRQAVAAERGRLVDWVARHEAELAGVSLARPERLSEVLGGLIRDVAQGDPGRLAWWSVYLSDLMTDLAEGAVTYDWAAGRLSGAPEAAAAVTLPALAHRARKSLATPLTQFLDREVAGAALVDRLSFERLPARGRRELALVVETGRDTPRGSYRAEVSSGGAPPVTVTVRVLPGLLDVALTALAVLVPLALVLLSVSRVGRAVLHELAANRQTLRARQARFGDWQRFRARQAAALAGQAEDPEAVLADFSAAGLHEALSPALFGQLLRARQADAAQVAEFLRRVDRWFGGRNGGHDA